MSVLSGLSRLKIFLKIPNKNLSFTVENLFTNSFGNSMIHTSHLRKDLMEFFDSKENWSKPEVKVGRSWKIEELRIKSNSDLHKLWYILLKEKNMLLTMEHEYNRQGKGLPSPERLDKVEESMENLEAVVRERNRAYFELETGETGERPSKTLTNCFGLEYEHVMSEYLIKKEHNAEFLANERLNNFTTDHEYVEEFLRKLDEKKKRIELYEKKENHHKACELMRKFPHLDEEALKAEFPDIDIEAVKNDKRSKNYR